MTKRTKNEISWTEYIQLQKVIKKQMAQAHNNYINRLFEESEDDTTQKNGMKRFGAISNP